MGLTPSLIKEFFSETQVSDLREEEIIVIKKTRIKKKTVIVEKKKRAIRPEAEKESIKLSK